MDSLPRIICHQNVHGVRFTSSIDIHSPSIHSSIKRLTLDHGARRISSIQPQEYRMLTGCTQRARNGAAQHVSSCVVRAQTPVSTHFERSNVDSRAAWTKVRVPNGAGAWSITRTGSSGARLLCQPPHATGNGATGGLTVAISGMQPRHRFSVAFCGALDPSNRVVCYR